MSILGQSRPVYNWRADAVKWEEPITDAQFYPERLKFRWAVFLQDYMQSIYDLNDSRKVREIFSGAWVSEIFGLEGKKLGALMQRFTSQFPTSEAFKNFSLTSSKEELVQKVISEKAFID